MAMGASLMTRLMSFIITSNRPCSVSCRASVAGDFAMTMPIPKIRAKTMTGRIWFSAAALKTLDGIMSRKNWPASMLLGALPTIVAAPSAPSASKRCASSGSTPSPGRK